MRVLVAAMAGLPASCYMLTLPVPSSHSDMNFWYGLGYGDSAVRSSRTCRMYSLLIRSITSQSVVSDASCWRAFICRVKVERRGVASLHIIFMWLGHGLVRRSGRPAGSPRPPSRANCFQLAFLAYLVTQRSDARGAMSYRPARPSPACGPVACCLWH